MSTKRRRRSRIIPTLIAAFYAGGIAGWWLHATFSPGNDAPAARSAPMVNPEPLLHDAPAATTGKSEPDPAHGAVRPGAAPTGDVAVIGADPIAELRRHHLRLPIDGADLEAMKGGFAESRGGGARGHGAVDIVAPRYAPVRAVEAGTIAKLFFSKAGGNTIYPFDPTGRFSYYYAHLDRYADGLREGQQVAAGDIIGYVAPAATLRRIRRTCISPCSG